MKQDSTYVYFIRPVGLDGPIKIGISDSPADRLKTLHANSPFPLEIIGTVVGAVEDEGFLHRSFISSHSHGEWFRSSPRLRDVIAEILSAKTIDVVRAKLAPPSSLKLGKGQIPSDDRNKYLSYSIKIRKRTNKSFYEGDEFVSFRAPPEIENILSRWRGDDGHAVLPTASEIALLDQFIADPKLVETRKRSSFLGDRVTS
jgi:hypothetical protein